MDEEDARQFQQQLHNENCERLRQLEEGQRTQIRELATIVANTACLPGLASRISSLEKSRNMFLGALAVIAAIGPVTAAAIGATVEWTLNKTFGK